MNRVCQVIHPRPADTRGTCPICRAACDSVEYRRLFGEGLPPAAYQSCVHLGGHTGGWRTKLNCVADPPVTVPLLGCAVHGECTETEGARGTACCRHCGDRKLPAPENPRPPPTYS